MIVELLPETLAVCRLPADAELPLWIGGGFQSVTHTPDELSIVCREDYVPQEVQAEWGWRCLRVAGVLEFGLTSILASLTVPLAEAEISVFALSTFDTDYLLVKAERLEAAIRVLEAEGHHVEGGTT